MKKFWNGLKKRYLNGIAEMKVDAGLTSMMYLAATIVEIFILCKVTPENYMQYIKTLGVNLVLVYLYSIVVNQFDQNNTSKLVQGLVFVAIGLFVGCTIARGINFLLLLALFVAPIIVAIAMIFVQENCVLFEDFINLKGIGNFGTVVLTTLIPVTTITVPLIFLEWSILYKIAIVAGFVLIAPLICWADSEGYGIFGTLGIEW